MFKASSSSRSEMASLMIDSADSALTVDPQRRIIQNPVVLIHDDRTTAAAPAAEFTDAPANRVINVSGLELMSGFVNTHEYLWLWPYVRRGPFVHDIAAPFIAKGCTLPEKSYRGAPVGQHARRTHRVPELHDNLACQPPRRLARHRVQGRRGILHTRDRGPKPPRSVEPDWGDHGRHSLGYSLHAAVLVARGCWRQ
jgi:hypothetical protein